MSFTRTSAGAYWVALAIAASACACGAQGAAQEPKQMDNAVPIAPGSTRAALPEAPAPIVGSGEYEEGVAALASGDVDGAKATYKRMHDKDARSAEASVLLGLIDEKTGDVAGAEKAYREAITLRADLEAAYVDLGALLIDRQKLDDSLAVSRAGLSKLPTSAALHANAAAALAGKGDTAGATGEFDQATRAAPDDAMLLMTYGHWLGVWKQGDAALAKLRAARPLAKDAGMLAAIGEEMKALGAFADCVPTLDKAIAMKDAAELRVYRAVCKLGAKDAAGATTDLRAAIAQGYAPAHFYLARVMSDAGDWKGAVGEYEAFLKLEPNVPASKVAREKLKQAKEHLKK